MTSVEPSPLPAPPRAGKGPPHHSLVAKARQPSARTFTLGFGFAVVLVGLSLWLHVRRDYQATMDYWRVRQSSVADDRSQAVSAWLNEHRADAEVLAGDPMIVTLVSAKSRLAEVVGPLHLARKRLILILDQLVKAQDHVGVYVFDGGMQIVAQSSKSEELTSTVSTTYRDLVRVGRTQIDLFPGSQGKTLVSFGVPILPPEANPPRGPNPGPALGAVVLLVDPAGALFPLVTAESVPTRTGETVLVRRRGNEIVFFAPLRNFPRPAGEIVRPLTRGPAAARAALDGLKTFGEFFDYRDVRVLAATRRIPATGWGLVQKIDRDEALADFRHGVWVDSFAAALLLVASAGLFWLYRRQARAKALNEEQRLFRDLLESAPDGMAVVNQNREIVLVSSAVEEMTGYSREEVLGKSVPTLVVEPPRREQARPFAGYFGESSARQSQGGFEGFGKRKDGTEFPAEVSFGTIETSQGRMVVIAIRDVTERKKAEQAAREQSKLAESFFNYSVSSLVMLDRNYNLLRVNEAYARACRRDINEFVGRNHFDMYPSDAKLIFDEVVRTKCPFETFTRAFVFPDQPERGVTYWDWTLVPVLDPQGEVEHLIFSLNEVTERVRAEEALRRSHDELEQRVTERTAELRDANERLQAELTERQRAEQAALRAKQDWERTFDAVPDLVAILDDRHRIVRANRAMAQRLGLSPEQCAGASCYKVVHGLDRPPGFCPHVLTLTDGQEHVCEVHEDRLGGDFLVSTTPLTNEEGRPIGSVHVARDITERKRAEEALRRSEEDLNRAQAVAHTGSWRLDTRRNELLWSDETYGMFGIPKGASLSYETFLGTVHPDDRDYVHQRWSAALRGEPYDIEHRIIVGTAVKWVRERAQLEFEREGVLQGGFGTVQDITERKQAEEALRASEERFRVLSEAMPQIVWSTDVTGAIDYLNQRASEYAGVQPGDIHGWDWTPVIHRDDQEASLSAWRRALATSETFVNEQRLRRADGQFRWHLARGVPVRNEKGDIIRWIGTATDIHDQKMAEQELERRVAERTAELAKSKALLETVTSNAPVILFATDAQGVFTVHTGKAIPTMGREAGEIIGKDYREVLANDPQGRDNFRKVLAGEAFTAVVEGPEDTAFETHYNPIRDAEGKITGMIGLSLDITERKRAEEVVRQATEEVRDLYNNAPCGYHSLDKDGLFLRINDTELQWLGYAREEVVGKLRFTDVITEKTKHLFAEHFPRLKATGLVRDMEYELVRKDGSVLPVLLSATALRDEDGNYVMSRSTVYDMTEIERARAAVKAERQRFYDILEMLPVYLVLLTPDYHVPFANRFFRERFGESNGKRCYEYLFGRSEPCEICETYTALKTKAPHRWEWTGPDSRNYDIYDFPFTDTDGSTLILEMGIDITERKRAERESRRLNRALRTISECNQALVRARKESELLQGICRILVEEGGYRLAWVGLAEQDEAKSVRPAAYAGVEEGYLETLKITWADTERGRGPTGTAIRTGQPTVCRNIPGDPSFAPWREEAVRRGYASSIALPLVLDGQPAAALMLYSQTADAFDTAETQLLTELANDLAYGIRTLRTRAERQKAEEALRRNEERYRALVVATSQMVWTTNAQGEVVGDLPSWRAYSGQSEEEVEGWGWVNALHPQDREKTAAVWSRAIETRSLYETEYRVRRHDGEYRYFAVRGVPVLEPDASVREWVGTCTDITERKAASDALRRASDYNRSLIEASPDPLVTISPEGTITDVNRATERVTGLSRQELIGTDFCDYFTEPGLARAGYQQVFRECLVRDYELEIRHRDGHITPVLYSASVYRDEPGQVIGVFAAARDITERRRMEEELRQLSGRLLNAQDEERRRIARELHDSTTQNLTAIGLNLGLINGCPKIDEECRKYLSESMSLTELTLNEIRNISYLLHPPLLDEMGLTTALEYFVDGFSRRAGIAVSLEISPELGRLPKDTERMLFRVVQESLSNVHRHSGSPTARIAIVRSPEGVLLEVVDSGHGIPTPSAEKPARPGIGIPGMRERVKSLGGRFEIASGAQGTTVRVNLPSSKSES